MSIKISAVLYLLTLIMAGCIPIKPASEGEITVPKTPAGIEVAIKADKTVYQAKEPIAIQLTLTNRGDETFKYTFPSAQIYDFVARKEGEEVWRWSADKMFAMMLIDFTLEPKKLVTYDETWDQKDVEGNFVAPGTYELIGIIKTSPETVSSPLTIEIR